MSDFRVGLNRPAAMPGPAANPWFWHPSRVDARLAPSWFTRQLRALDGGEDLEATWNPINQRWQLWSRAPKINHPICQGWRLLFIHNGPDGEHLPLDERAIARLLLASARTQGSAKAYIDRVCREYERDQEKKEDRLRQEAIDRAMPHYDYSQIKNIGTGSKFSTYFA